MKILTVIVVGLFSGFIGAILGPIISAKLDFKYFKKKKISSHIIELINNAQKELLNLYLEIKLFLNANKTKPEKLSEFDKFVPTIFKIDMIISTYEYDDKLIEISNDTKNVDRGEKATQIHG